MAVILKGIDKIDSSPTGNLTFGDPLILKSSIRSQAKNCIGGVLDFSQANYWVCNCTGDVTFSFINVPSDSDVISVVIQLHDAGSHIVSFPSNVYWGGGIPSFTSGGSDLVGFITIDGGTNWRGMGLNFNSSVPYHDPS